MFGYVGFEYPFIITILGITLKKLSKKKKNSYFNILPGYSNPKTSTTVFKNTSYEPFDIVIKAQYNSHASILPNNNKYLTYPSCIK